MLAFKSIILFVRIMNSVDEKDNIPKIADPFFDLSLKKELLVLSSLMMKNDFSLLGGGSNHKIKMSTSAWHGRESLGR